MFRERIMLTQAIPAVQQLRRVQGFDPLRFLKRNANGGIGTRAADSAALVPIGLPRWKNAAEPAADHRPNRRL